MKFRFTDSAVKALKARADGGRQDYRDTVVRGLTCRVSQDGTKVWACVYRVRGQLGRDEHGNIRTDKSGEPIRPLRRKTLGVYPVMTLAQARDAAILIRQKARAGKDPDEQEKRAKAGAIETAVEEYLKTRSRAKGWRPATSLKRRLLFKNHILPRWAGKNVRDIDRGMVHALVQGVAEQKKVAANSVLGAITGLFRYALSAGLIDVNPAIGVERPTRTKSRDRFLEAHEIAKLWPAFDKLVPLRASWAKLVLASGQRQGEVRCMRWSDVDFESGVWTIPGELTKNGKPHPVPLSSLMREILASVPRREGYSHVFPLASADRPFDDESMTKVKLDKLVSLARPWRWHDLRATFVSLARSDLNLPLDIVGAVVNHRGQGITEAVYQRKDLLDQKRRALEAWARYLTKIIQPGEKKIVPLRG